MHKDLIGKKPPTKATVLKAISECRETGEAAFRAKYVKRGKPGKTYIHMNFGGERFPVKHIWAASFRPAVRTNAFNPSHAEDGLEKLGFLDIVDDRKTKASIVKDEPTTEERYFEGEAYRAELKVLRRNRKIVKLVKENSNYTCEACKFNFERHYGAEMGKGLIEVHHLFPLHLRDKEYEVKKEHLAALCANCHRVAHQRDPPYPVEEIREQFLKPATRKNIIVRA